MNALINKKKMSLGTLACGYPLSVCVRPPDYMHVGIVDQHCALRVYDLAADARSCATITVR